MIGVILLWVLTGMAASFTNSRANSEVMAVVHQTALLPLSFQPPSSFWAFIRIKWERMATNGSVPILVYLIDRCKSSGVTHQWWERECLRHKEVAGGYQERADIFRNGTLIIQQVELKDAGIYLATVLATGVEHETTVNLTVTEASLASSKADSQVMAVVHQTALLPLSFQPPSSSWTFISIKWERMIASGSVPILVYLIDRCNTSGVTHQWWERECLRHKEVAGGYQKRADIFRNGTLIIQQVELKDAGIYLATILATGVEHETTVNLTVTGAQCPFVIEPEEELLNMAGQESHRARPSRRSLPAAASPEQEKAPQGPVKENNRQAFLEKCIPCRSAKHYATASLSLDPNTAHPHLYVSEDLKSVKWGATEQNVMSSSIRYNIMASVLSQEAFTSGRICWEVEVLEPGEWWAVGIVKESANRQGTILFAPEGGYWAVQRINGKYEAITYPQRTNLSLHHAPTRISVCLDFQGGQVAFFDGNTDEEFFTFPKSNFLGERIRAFFLVYNLSAELMIHS
nr:tripartite motif-containing protein 10-like isoform X2 [Pogona vitticeps]